MVWKSFSQEELLEKQKCRVGLGCSSQILSTKISWWGFLSADQPGSHEKRNGGMNKKWLKNEITEKNGNKSIIELIKR